ncbi:hypothetical protein CCUS01_03926, partial [Colletotrichum cuscutae]
CRQACDLTLAARHQSAVACPLASLRARWQSTGQEGTRAFSSFALLLRSLNKEFPRFLGRVAFGTPLWRPRQAAKLPPDGFLDKLRRSDFWRWAIALHESRSEALPEGMSPSQD